MRYVIIGAVALTALALWYVLVGRCWLKTKSWTKPFFDWIEPIEIALWDKSETMLTARLLWLGGFLVTGYDALAVFLPTLDLTPLTDRLLASVPQDLRGLVVSGAIGLLGLLIAWLRKRTTKPLELVKLPDAMPTEVAAVIDMAEAAKDAAVSTAKEAQTEGRV